MGNVALMGSLHGSVPSFMFETQPLSSTRSIPTDFSRGARRQKRRNDSKSSKAPPSDDKKSCVEMPHSLTCSSNGKELLLQFWMVASNSSMASMFSLSDRYGETLHRTPKTRNLGNRSSCGRPSLLSVRSATYCGTVTWVMHSGTSKKYSMVLRLLMRLHSSTKMKCGTLSLVIRSVQEPRIRRVYLRGPPRGNAKTMVWSWG